MWVTLLARLYPKYRPHKILNIAQGMDTSPEAVAYFLVSILSYLIKNYHSCL